MYEEGRGRRTASDNGERRRGGRNRWAIAASVGGAFVAVVLVLMVPVGTPMSHDGILVPASTTTFKAPYKGAPQQAFEWVSDGTCGAKESATPAPSFNMSNGMFRGTINGTAAGCGSFNDSVEVAELGGLSTAGEIAFTTTTGSHTVRAYWTLVYTPTLTAHATKTAYASSSSAIFLYANILDLTNGTQFGQTVPFVVDNSTNSSTISHQSTAKATLVVTGKLVAGHRYAIQSWIEAFVFVFASPGAKTAYGTLNLATSGNHAILNDVTLN
jgi:hypothetical protein